MSYTITQTTVLCYKIRHSSNQGWADITIDENPSGGRIQIASDWGSWQYYWGAAGTTLRKFLLGLDKGYVAGKFGAGKYADLDATIKQYRERIISERRKEWISAEAARMMWDECKELEQATSVESFTTIMWNDCGELMKWWDGTPDIVHTYEPGFNRFWETVWPHFMEHIKNQTEAAQL